VKSTLSLQRLWLLIRVDTGRNFRTAATVSAVFAGIILLHDLVMPDIARLHENFYLGWFISMLFVWGVIATSRSFRDLHDNTRNEAYLLIPASTLEKTLARLLSLTFGFLVYLLLFTFLLSLAIEALNALLANQRNALFNPFNPVLWKLIPLYFVIHSYYFLGAAWFRKTHFLKTTLVAIITLISLTIVVLMSTRIFLGPYWWENIDSAADMLYFTYEPFIEATLIGAQIVILAIVPLVCWYTAYLRVRETQVSDGV